LLPWDINESLEGTSASRLRVFEAGELIEFAGMGRRKENISNSLSVNKSDGIKRGGNIEFLILPQKYCCPHQPDGVADIPTF
jgi:hypothetical protein